MLVALWGWQQHANTLTLILLTNWRKKLVFSMLTTLIIGTKHKIVQLRLMGMSLLLQVHPGCKLQTSWQWASSNRSLLCRLTQLPDHWSGHINSIMLFALLDKSHIWIMRNPFNTPNCPVFRCIGQMNYINFTFAHVQKCPRNRMSLKHERMWIHFLLIYVTRHIYYFACFANLSNHTEGQSW